VGSHGVEGGWWLACRWGLVEGACLVDIAADISFKEEEVEVALEVLPRQQGPGVGVVGVRVSVCWRVCVYFVAGEGED
jgi:hypothetical protein